jgi:hypothetical protein
MYKKAIIISVILFFSFCVKGQTFKFDSSDYKVFLGKIDTTIYYLTNIQKRTEVKDTVRVLMLVSDTVHRFSTDMKYKPCPDGTNPLVACYDAIKIDLGNGGSGMIYWTYGYEERLKECCINGNNSSLAYYQPEPYYLHVRYLDVDKKSLKESIVVWMAKGIKNN